MNAKPKDSILINDNNLSPSILQQEHKLIYSGFYWHKIYVQNANMYTREFVLRTLMNTVHPLDFIPVCYTVEGEIVCFLLKNCGAAILELCRLKLNIPHPEDVNLPPFKIAILLKHANANEMKIEIQSNISAILKKRYNYTNKTLNLDGFYRDTDLLEFCPLSQPKLMYFVLHLSREYDIQTLKLSNNDIELLKPLEALYNEKCLKALSFIDLRKNNIKSTSELQMLKTFPLTELMLDENPICENITEHSYLKAVREYCPKLLKLDGFRVPQNGILSLRRNYLCDSTGQELVDQFLEHYFTLYDSSNRLILDPLYHKNAMFSLTCNYLINQSTSVGARLSSYKKVSRNIKLLTDFSKSSDGLYLGGSRIVNMLTCLPMSEHDPYTFTVDLTYFTEKTVIFTVTGVFREPGESLLEPERVFGFTRTFVLMTGSNQEFNIVNEQLHIANATSSQHARAFKVSRIPTSTYINIPVPKNAAERDEYIEGLASITNLNSSWAKKCLEETNYDLKLALNMFVNFIKANKLPAHAFRVFEEPKITQNVPPPHNPVYSIHEPSDIIFGPSSQSYDIFDKSPSPPVIIEDNSYFPNKETEVVLPVLKPIKKDIVQPVSATPKKDNLKIERPPLHLNIISSISIPKPATAPKPVPAPVNVKSPVPALLAPVTDPIILEALKLPVDVTPAAAKPILEKAAKVILEKYTTVAKYYKAVGKEFYKCKLFTEAREFLANGMIKMSKQLGEEVYSLFTLYEIQFGDLKVATGMIDITVKTYPVNKTVRFIGEHIAKLNIVFARKMFKYSLNLHIPFAKKQDILKAYKDFEIKFGVPTTVSQANIICQEVLLNERNMQEAKATGEAVKKPVVQTMEIAQPEDLPINESDNTEPVSSNINVFKDPQFIEFQHALYLECGILPQEMNYSEIETIRNHNNTDSHLRSICESVLTKYNYDLYILKVITDKYYERKLFEDLKRILANGKNKIKDHLRLNNIILFFKIRTDLDSGKNEFAQSKLLTHIKVCNERQLVSFFYDLQSLDKEFVRTCYVAAIKALTNVKRKILIYLYKGFELRYGTLDTIKAAERFIGDTETPAFVQNDLMKNTDTISPAILQSFRNMYSEKPKGKFLMSEAVRFREKYQHSIGAELEACRALYYHLFLTKARGTAKSIQQTRSKLPKIECDKIRFERAMMECKFGSLLVAYDILKSIKCPKPYVDVIFATITVLLKQNKVEEAKSTLTPMLMNFLISCHSDFQRFLFENYKQWIRDYKVHLFGKQISVTH